MHDFLVRTMAQGGGDGLGLEPLDAGDLGRVVVDQPTGEFDAARVAQGDDVPFVKIAAGFSHADGQQAASLLFDRGRRRRRAPGSRGAAPSKPIQRFQEGMVWP